MGPPFFNKVNIPDRLVPVVSDRRGPAAGLAQDFHGKSEEEFRLAAVGGVDCRGHRVALGLREFLFATLCLMLSRVRGLDDCAANFIAARA